MTLSSPNPPAWTPPRWLVIAASVVLVGVWIAARLSPERGLVSDPKAQTTIAATSEATSEPPGIAPPTETVASESAAAAEAPALPATPVTPGPKPAKSSEKKSDAQKPEKSPTDEADPASKRIVVQNITIKDQSGKTVYKGEIDLTPTFARIERGDRHEHRNDGSTFRNLEGRLPKKPAGYYKEYVHPTPGISGPGPQRVVIGEQGEAYYTHDHYRTFRKVRS